MWFSSLRISSILLYLNTQQFILCKNTTNLVTSLKVCVCMFLAKNLIKWFRHRNTQNICVHFIIAIFANIITSTFFKWKFFPLRGVILSSLRVLTRSGAIRSSPSHVLCLLKIKLTEAPGSITARAEKQMAGTEQFRSLSATSLLFSYNNKCREIYETRK
jgi:hypothetical protein